MAFKSKISVLGMTCFVWIVLGCSGQSGVGVRAQSRQVARASQGMVVGAQLGASGVWDSQYREREPNPNAYVGELLYRRYCQSCHEGGGGPAIVDGRATSPDAESDYYIIRYGLITMKGFRSRLTKFQILDILAYMKVDLTDFKPSEMRFGQSRSASVREAKGSGGSESESAEKDLKDGLSSP